MNEFLGIMILPFIACLILAGIHAYLGFHVIERQVIFVDLALAQIAALGLGVAIAFGYSPETLQAYVLSLGFTVIGAVLFSMTRLKRQSIPQEAMIGIIYVMAAALLILVLSRSAQGDEHLRQALTGNILLVNWGDIIKMAVIYLGIGVFHFFCRRQFFAISRDPSQALTEGINIKLWDILFYISFGFVVTSSVKIAGVLLVFSFLIVPPVCAIFFSSHLKSRLVIGWIVGLVASVLGITASYYLDIPTGASVVCAFGLILILCLPFKKIS